MKDYDTTPSVTCTCKEWKHGIDELNTMVLSAELTRGYVYTSPPFKFCPWCGKELVENLDKSKEL